MSIINSVGSLFGKIASVEGLDIPDDFIKIRDSFTKYIVKPVNAFGLGGFVFDIEGETTHNLGTEITDHYTESNQNIQDHIAVKPLKITLNTFVGEVVYRLDDSTNTTLQKTVQKLTTLNSFLPPLSAAAQQAKDFIKDDINLDSLTSFALNQASDLWALTKNLNPGVSKQQQAYLYFEALMNQKMLVSVQTPFKFLTNMAIETIIARQKEDSKFVSDFMITLKQIRIASTKNVVNPILSRVGAPAPLPSQRGNEDYQGMAKFQRQIESNNGLSSGVDLTPDEGQDLFISGGDAFLDDSGLPEE